MTPVVDFAGRRVTVVGGNGFLGVPLVHALADAGAIVRVFDRYRTPPRHRLGRQITVVQGDFLSGDGLAASIDGAQDVFHFLSATTPAASAADPLIDVTTNVTAGVGLFSLCARRGVERVFFASSGGTVYGSSPPPHHELSALDPTSPYGIGKVSLENYLTYFALQHGLRSVSLRISNPYGPGHQEGAAQGIVPIALRAARDGTPLTQLGDGSMTRDYVYVPDLVSMVMQVARDPRFSTYNLGSGVGTSLSDVFATVRRVTGLDLDLTEAPCPPSFVQTSVLDTTRFRDAHGTPSLTCLEDGVRQTWEHLRAEDRQRFAA